MNSEDTTPAAPAIDVAALLDRCQNNAQLAGRLAARFICEAPAQIAALHDALHSENAVEFARLLHKLRGSLGIFGATVAHDAAAVLEGRAGSRSLTGCEPMLVDLASEVQRACGELAELGR